MDCAAEHKSLGFSHCVLSVSPWHLIYGMVCLWNVFSHSNWVSSVSSWESLALGGVECSRGLEISRLLGGDKTIFPADTRQEVLLASWTSPCRVTAPEGHQLYILIPILVSGVHPYWGFITLVIFILKFMIISPYCNDNQLSVHWLSAEHSSQPEQAGLQYKA